MTHSLVQNASLRNAIASMLEPLLDNANGIPVPNPTTEPTLHYLSIRIAVLIGPGHQVELLEVVPDSGCAPPIFTALTTYPGND